MTAHITDAPITPAQVKSIHVALHRRGVDDADYRALLAERFGVDSCKALTRRQASDLLAALGRPLPNPPGEWPRGERRPVRRPAVAPAPAAEGTVVRLPSRAQRNLVAELAGEIEWEAEDGLARWLRATLGIDRVSTAADAQRAINGLKGLKRHGHGHGRRGGGE